jgi:serine/threonine-protein kinase
MICIGGHVAMTVPIVTGWIADPGVFPSPPFAGDQRVVAELLVVAMLFVGYLLGRWARRSAASTLADLRSALQIIGDREQALAEVADEAARQRAVNEGRWTGHKLGTWRVGLVLGRGAMGEVYEASAPEGTPAALKVLTARAGDSTSIVERFHREMEIALRLDSPHIARVFEISPRESPVPYIVMERLHGVDLATRLRNEQNRLAIDELAALLDQVARGLEVARLAGVVHRDLKPHNLFHHAGSVWKILDFGVSKVLGSEGTLTGDGIVGTPQYMAPEQASGGAVTHLTDVYALGSIAYRCLTGRSPFKGKDIAELVYQVVHTPPVRPSTLARGEAPPAIGSVTRGARGEAPPAIGSMTRGARVPPAIDDVLAVAMAKDARRRFASAVAFAQAFSAARRGHGTVEVPADAWR